jgi:dihydrofolate reductase
METKKNFYFFKTIKEKGEVRVVALDKQKGSDGSEIKTAVKVSCPKPIRSMYEVGTIFVGDSINFCKKGCYTTKNFRRLTIGKVVVLGRKTLETFPQGQPLNGRTNIILSRDESYKAGDAIIVHSVDELLEKVKAYNTDDVYIIGGDSIYKQFLPYCDEAIVTKVDHEYEADAYFPNLDEDSAWKIVDESDDETYFDLDYKFVTYKKK